MNGSILIIHRNGLHLTKRAVNTALLQDIPVDVLVIDNASKDGLSYWLRTKPVAATYLLQQKSLSACWNAGLRAFWSTGAKEVLVLNNDLELRSDTYRILRDLNLPFVSCPSVDSKDRLGVPGDRAIEDLTFRDHPGFSCFMIRKSVTDKVGWFDEYYFPAYCEDCDYHIRMHRAGVRAVCTDLPVYHLGSGTIANADPGEQARIRRGADASRERFRKQYGCLPGTEEYYSMFK